MNSGDKICVIWCFAFTLMVAMCCGTVLQFQRDTFDGQAKLIQTTHKG